MTGWLAGVRRCAGVARAGAAWKPANAAVLWGDLVARERPGRSVHDDETRIRAAARWLARAQDATGDGGFAGRYRLRTGWTSSYPETTGYLIPTLLRLADRFGEPEWTDRARRAFEFLLAVQLPSGAFPGREIAENRTEPSVFNTGQVLNGLQAWHAATGDDRAREAARRAADWLVEGQDADGIWRRHLYGASPHAYSAHAACWLADLGAYLNEPRYLEAARAHAAWVLKLQDPETGWFDKAGFRDRDHELRRAFTHTIAYTIWGMLLTGRLTGDAGMVAAARRAARAVARRLELDRWLPGTLDARWRGQATYGCLTGNCQMALIWFELDRLSSEPALVSAGCKALDLVRRAQIMDNNSSGLQGGIPGSDPLWGTYISLALPNWAAKFFIDALFEEPVALARLDRPTGGAPFPADVPTTIPPAPARASPEAAPRIILVSSAGSHRAPTMLSAWDRFAFRPAAVVMVRRQRPGLWSRLTGRLRRRGFLSLPTPAREHGRTVPAANLPRGEDYCRRAGIALVELGPLTDPATLAAIRSLAPDLIVAAGAGILRPELLAIPRLGTVNAHMGVLPWYRGMNVAEWACLEGGATGCTVHYVDKGIDTGAILCARAVPLDGIRDVRALRQRIDAVQIELLGELIRYLLATGTMPPARAQQAEEGRQYFAMHGKVRGRLERRLESAG